MDSESSSHSSDINFDPAPSSPQSPESAPPSVESAPPPVESPPPVALIEMEAEEADEASEGDEASDDDEVIGEAAGSQEDGDPHSTAAVRILML